MSELNVKYSEYISDIILKTIENIKVFSDINYAAMNLEKFANFKTVKDNFVLSVQKYKDCLLRCTQENRSENDEEDSNSIKALKFHLKNILVFITSNNCYEILNSFSNAKDTNDRNLADIYAVLEDFKKLSENIMMCDYIQNEELERCNIFLTEQLRTIDILKADIKKTKENALKEISELVNTERRLSDIVKNDVELSIKETKIAEDEFKQSSSIIANILDESTKRKDDLCNHTSIDIEQIKEECATHIAQEKYLRKKNRNINAAMDEMNMNHKSLMEEKLKDLKLVEEENVELKIEYEKLKNISEEKENQYNRIIEIEEQSKLERRQEEAAIKIQNIWRKYLKNQLKIKHQNKKAKVKKKKSMKKITTEKKNSLIITEKY